MKKLVLAILLFTSSFCYCQTYSLNDFIEFKASKLDGKVWLELNHSIDKEFVFHLDSGVIKISKYKPSRYVDYEIHSGKLIGVDMGEWGGGLYYKQNDSTRDFFVNGKNGNSIQPGYFGGLIVPSSNPIHQVIKDYKLLQSGNIKFIFEFNGSTYFLGGLAHGGSSYGGLYSLSSKSDSILISQKLNIDDAPSAMSIYKDHIYLATSSGFYLIDETLNMKKIFDNMFWEGLYPTSVLLLDENQVFVTFRGGYVKIDPKKQDYKIYKAK